MDSPKKQSLPGDVRNDGKSWATSALLEKGKSVWIRPGGSYGGIRRVRRRSTEPVWPWHERALIWFAPAVRLAVQSLPPQVHDIASTRRTMDVDAQQCGGVEQRRTHTEAILCLHRGANAPASMVVELRRIVTTCFLTELVMSLWRTFRNVRCTTARFAQEVQKCKFRGRRILTARCTTRRAAFRGTDTRDAASTCILAMPAQAVVVPSRVCRGGSSSSAHGGDVGRPCQRI